MLLYKDGFVGTNLKYECYKKGLSLNIECSYKSFERLVFLFIFTIAILGVFFSRTNLAYYENHWVREDGLVEWLTVLALFINMVLTLYRVFVLKSFRNGKFLFCLCTFAFIFFFGLMEEISWGQRIIGQFFDLQLPEFFAKYNTQGETNIHNLKLAGIKINKLFFGLILTICLVLYTFALPVLYRKMAKLRVLVDSLALPIPQNRHIIGYLVLVGLHEAITSSRRGEILEFGSCWIFFLIFLKPYNDKIFSRELNSDLKMIVKEL